MLYYWYCVVQLAWAKVAAGWQSTVASTGCRRSIILLSYSFVECPASCGVVKLWRWMRNGPSALRAECAILCPITFAYTVYLCMLVVLCACVCIPFCPRPSFWFLPNPSRVKVSPDSSSCVGSNWICRARRTPKTDCWWSFDGLLTGFHSHQLRN